MSFMVSGFRCTYLKSQDLGIGNTESSENTYIKILRITIGNGISFISEKILRDYTHKIVR